MVVLVDGAAHGTQAVVAVGEGIGNGELLHAGGPGLLDDAHIGDVVGQHGVKVNLQMIRVAGDIVGLQNVPGHGLSAALVGRDGSGPAGNAVCQKHTVVVERYHISSSCKIPAGAGFFLAQQYSTNPGICKAILQEKKGQLADLEKCPRN